MCQVNKYIYLNYTNTILTNVTVTNIIHYLRVSVPDFPNGVGPLVVQTSIPWVLWMLRSIVGVNGRPFRLQCWKFGGRSALSPGPPGLKNQ